MSPKVSIIILNWNQPELTVNCVKSVLQQGYKDFEILLVDNASEDNSMEIFKKEFGSNEDIRIIENSENLGYAGGNNEGVKNADGRYIVILNNDTLVEENWLEELVKGLESDKNIKAVGSVGILTDFANINREDIKKRKKEIIEHTKKYNGTQTLLNYNAEYLRKRELDDVDLIDDFMVGGYSFIYDKKVVDLPFDPEYFIYSEDMYFSWLLRLKGYDIKISMKSWLLHYYNVTRKSKGKINKYFTFLGERNRIMNLLIFYEVKNLIRIFPLLLINIILLNIAELRKSPYRIKAYLWLLSHPRKILEKRRYIQSQRKVPDTEIISKMSCILTREGLIEQPFLRRILKFINRCFCIYCSIVGLKTIEK